MFSLIKKLFKGKHKWLFSLPTNLTFTDAIEFTSPNEVIYNELKQKLVVLSKKNSSFFIEKPLKNKKFVTCTDINEIVELLKIDLKNNFEEYRLELSGEPLGFVYYLGNQILMSNSVEIIQKIYHKESNIGNLYYSFVIKFKDGKYYYWK